MKLELLDSKGIDLRRVIFDPGIGFGKTAAQSLAIIERIEEFSDLPLRILIGHSRKSFLKNMGAYDRADRDVATLALSMNLARKGVDILRVHDFESHTRAIFADLQVRP
jgi:2-amino-4-hydroxy-6-hydroxymethyldihydropteridine diphosphokinase/dihydropteroate synthase